MPKVMAVHRQEGRSKGPAPAANSFRGRPNPSVAAASPSAAQPVTMLHRAAYAAWGTARGPLCTALSVYCATARDPLEFAFRKFP
jgi:hypothetical protein